MPAHCLLLSLDQHLSYPRIPSCRIPVCRALWHCRCRPPWLCSQNFHSQNFIHAFDCHFWNGSVAKEKGPHPAVMLFLVGIYLIRYCYLTFYDLRKREQTLCKFFLGKKPLLLYRSLQCTFLGTRCMSGTVWMLGM